MIRKLILDTGPLGRLTHPQGEGKNTELKDWINEKLKEGFEIVIPEISDYELRREYVLRENIQGLKKLNAISISFTYLPISTQIMHQAAAFWAQVRKDGKPTADPHALDGDSILAAQALTVGAVVITENIGHLSRFDNLEVRRWQDFPSL